MGCQLHQLENDHLGRVAATGALLDDAGVAAANALSAVRALYLGPISRNSFSTTG